MGSFKVPFKQVKELIQKAFPDAKSRKPVAIEERNSYSVNDYWAGGSRSYCVFLDLATMNTLPSSAIPREQRQHFGNPFNLPIAEVKLSPQYCVVEHIIYCGKDLGYRIYVSPEVYNTLHTGFTGIALPSGVKPFELEDGKSS